MNTTTIYRDALHLFNEDRLEEALNRFILARDSMLSTCNLMRDVENSQECDHASPISTPKKDKLKKELAQLTISNDEIDIDKSDIKQSKTAQRRSALSRFDEGFHTFNCRIENEESFPHGMTAILYKIGKVHESMGNINQAVASYHDTITLALSKCCVCFQRAAYSLIPTTTTEPNTR